MSLEEFAEKITTCEKCRLREARCKVVMGRGTFPAKILFVGEAPGLDDNNEGSAFLGKAGETLNNALEYGGFTKRVLITDPIANTKNPEGIIPGSIVNTRGEIVNIPFYLDNMVRCRPPENRKPEVDEVNACWPWLDELIGAMNPKIIVPMGETAIQGLARKMGFKKAIGTKKIQELVGRVIVLDSGTVVVPAFHPTLINQRRNMSTDYLNFFSFLAQSYPNWLKIRGKNES